MMNDEDFLTEELEVLEGEDASLVALIAVDIQEIYGMTYNEYVHFRNSLVRRYDYKLPFSVLEKELIKKITIDLVAGGFISPHFNSPNEDIIFEITDKGLDAITEGMIAGQIEPETQNWEALFELRNKNMLN